jgi:hypothetical protein
MPSSKRPRPTRTYEIELRLGDIRHLFEKPELSPFSPAYREYSYTSGIEYIAGELYANTSYRAVQATILLPAEQVEEDTEEQARAARRRYCSAKLQDIQHDLAATLWRGLRALCAALVALFAFIGASKAVDGDTSVFLQVISEGLSIAGWVALWFPLESLTFTLWQHWLERMIYTRLRDMELTVQPAQAT